MSPSGDDPPDHWGGSGWQFTSTPIGGDNLACSAKWVSQLLYAVH
jgi:hypothetical protein